VAAYNSLGKSAYSAADTVTTLETPAAKAYKGPHFIPGKIEAEDFNDNEEGMGYFDADDPTNKGAQYRTNTVSILKNRLMHWPWIQYRLTLITANG
jgi:endoglucanase